MGLYGLLEKNHLPHQGLKPVSVVHLAFQSDILLTELFLPLSLHIHANQHEKAFGISLCISVCFYSTVEPLMKDHLNENFPLLKSSFFLKPFPTT